jgi:pyruvate,orthophosphate dikinase
MPEVYKELFSYQHKLETHFKDMQDIEFTVQEGKLWILQTRTGKRTGLAMLNIGMDMLDAGMIDEKVLFQRITPAKIDELLHPVFDLKELKTAKFVAKGLPASPGAATGQIVFFSEDATRWKASGKDVILVRIETSADDLQGMDAANAIVTARGGMTSHAAVVARGMGKCCVSGAGSLKIDYKKRKLYIDDKVFSEGDWISADGTHGKLYEGKIKTQTPEITGNFGRLMDMASKYARLKVHANADTPENARVARKFGAVGIGLCRTEHMFFGEERIRVMREMIMADTETGRRTALNKLLPFQRADFEAILEIMQAYPVTIRLLDPPLHEFLPADDHNQQNMADLLGISVEEVKEKVAHLQEVNPMLGHRGCRLGNTYPEITEMQVRAIMEAALNLKNRGIKAIPEIMIPLTSSVNELKMQIRIAEEEIQAVFAAYGDEVDYKIGTMIEIPRAAIIADQLAEHVQFFSFGTNDLTQMTFGFSRDDAGKFLPIYLDQGILKESPFEVLDQEGVGHLVAMGLEKGRKTNHKLVVGICGEHGGEPKSVAFCHNIGMDYVSCSPYRVPIARVAAAKAGISEA